MATPWVVRVLFVVGLAIGNLAHAMEPAFGSPPSAFFYDEDFEGVHGIPASWQVALGTWQADGQTYNSTTPTSAALTTIFEYPPIDQPGDITDQFDFDDFTLTARLRNQGGSASTLVGLVYLYSDPANYFEVAFSPTGIAYLRRMGGGQMETLAAATYPGGGQGVWFSVELHRTADTTSVSVNGVPVFTKTIQRSGVRGQVGLSTYNTTARFNKVSLSIPFGQQPFTEDFSDGVADEMGASSLCALTNNLSEDFSKQNKTFNGNVVEAIGSKARERLWVITRSRPAPRDQPYAFLKRLPSVEHRGTDTPSVDPD